MHHALSLAKGTPVLPEVLYMTGRIEGHRGDPNHGLKFFQLAEVARQAVPNRHGRSEALERLRATIAADAAKLYAAVGALDQARNHLAAAADSDTSDVQGVVAETRTMLGELDTARELAQGAVASELRKLSSSRPLTSFFVQVELCESRLTRPAVYSLISSTCRSFLSPPHNM
jgi:hypothetical protein